MGVKFSERLKAARKKQSLTQQEMADELGMSSRMYSDYENDKFTGESVRIEKYLEKLSYVESESFKKKSNKDETIINKYMITQDRLNKLIDDNHDMLQIVLEMAKKGIIMEVNQSQSKARYK